MKNKKYISLPLRLRRLISWIIGAVFFIGGLLKLMDPVGAGLVMKEYFKFFHIGFLNGIAAPVAGIMALGEAVLGTILITGIWRKVAAKITLATLSLFTLITLLLFIYNPAMDCGCFGEAIHLTHFQTLLKNIILLLLYLLAFYPIRNIGTPKKIKYVSFGIVSISVLLFAIYSSLRLPLIDFTDMKPGVMIASADNSWKNEGQEPEYIFIYEKDGKTASFTLEDLPDSTWTFIESKLAEEEDQGQPQAPYLSFTDEYGIYCDSLAAHGPVIAVSLYRPEKIKEKTWKKIYATVSAARAEGFTPILLAAATDEEMGKILDDIGRSSYPGLEGILYHSDYKTLITLNRSNGGTTYLHNGNIIRKWARQQAPDQEELKELAGCDAVENLITGKTSGSMKFQGLLLYTFAVLLLL